MKKQSAEEAVTVSTWSPSWPAWKWAVAGLVLAAIAWEAVSAMKRGGDLESYLRAGRRLAAGESVYVDELYPYMYPPFLAFLLVPLAFMGTGAAKLAWYLINVSLIILSLALLLRMARPQPGRRWLLAFLSLLFTMRFLVDSCHRGQANILILALCAVTLYFAGNGKAAWAALFLAMAIAVKLTALLLLAYFAWRRKFRLCALTASFLLLLLLLPAVASGFRRNIEHLRQYPRVAANIYDRDKLNQSLANFTYHLLHPVARRDNRDIHLLQLGEGAIKALTCLLAAALLLFTARLCRNGAGAGRWGPQLEFSIVIVLMLLLSPVSRKDHFVTLLLPYFFYLHALLDPVLAARLNRKKLLWACLLASFALASLTVESVVGNAANDLLESWFSVFWGTIILWLGLLLLRRETHSAPDNGSRRAERTAIR
ncbi:MAG: DUF2029 domain-containing protein [Acidobacteria bacterium]|nr:DUF2029 domain-containing protein [Acidobacteriota bacterium]